MIVYVCQRCGCTHTGEHSCDHFLTVVDSRLTQKPRGGYVHAMHVRCTECREDFYLVTNSHDVNYGSVEGNRAAVLAGQGFNDLIRSAPCRGGHHAR